MSSSVALEGRVGVGAVIAAILLPPLGVFIARGLCPPFWLSVLLTLVGWVPGVIFALIAVLSPATLGRLTA